MAEKNYKVNEAIEVVYQAPNAESGLSGVVAEVYLPDGAKDSGFPDVALVELDSEGVYKGEFTPDEAGEWVAICHKSDGDGQVVKRYSVGSYNVHSVGEAVANVDGDVATLDGKVVTVDGKVDTVDGKVDVVDAKATSIETKVDNISTQVGSLDTPPMVS